MKKKKASSRTFSSLLFCKWSDLFIKYVHLAWFSHLVTLGISSKWDRMFLCSKRIFMEKLILLLQRCKVMRDMGLFFWTRKCFERMRNFDYLSSKLLKCATRLTQCDSAMKKRILWNSRTMLSDLQVTLELCVVRIHERLCSTIVWHVKRDTKHWKFVKVSILCRQELSLHQRRIKIQILKKLFKFLLCIIW